MKRLGAAVLAATWLALGAEPACAQSYPSRSVTIVVPAAPGGVSSAVARALAQRLGEVWGQPVLVENKPGANHGIGATTVSRAAPDGHTLLLTESGFVINPTLHGHSGYDPTRDFAPIVGVVRSPQALAVHPSLQVRSVGDLIALARQRPGELTYATVGLGSVPHLNMEQLQLMAGVKLAPVHYRGSAPGITDVIAGHVQMIMVSVSALVEPARAGRLRLVAVGSSQGLAQIPEIPTIAESGDLPGYEASVWFGLLAPAATPAPVVDKINQEVARILSEPAFRERFLTPQMFQPMASSPAAFAAFIADDMQKWARIIREANLKPN